MDNNMKMFSTGVNAMKFGPKGLLTRINNLGSIKRGDILSSSLVFPTTSGEVVDLYNLSQKKNLVVFIYPGDREGLRYGELAGCTPEACSFRNAIDQFNSLNTIVFGLSMQSTERQTTFKQREHLNFDLISDVNGEFIKMFGIGMWQTIESEVNKETFPVRSTVIIQEGGLVEDIISVEEVDGHVDNVLEKTRVMIQKPSNNNYCNIL